MFAVDPYGAGNILWSHRRGIIYCTRVMLGVMCETNGAVQELCWEEEGVEGEACPDLLGVTCQLA